MAYPPPLDVDRNALFLDFDGTLVEFADDPADVGLNPAALDRLTVLQKALGGALGIVSGRRIVDLDGFLQPLRFAAAGVHGLERRATPAGETHFLAAAGALDEIRRRLVEALTREPCLKLEDKGMALVLHYRTVPELAAFAMQAMGEAVGGRDDMVVMAGDSIVEVHPAGMDKGRAVADIMSRPPFAGRVPLYIGDDTTDEYALRWVRDAGGVSIKVGNAESVAEFRLPDVAAVQDWLGVSRHEGETTDGR